MQTEIDQPIRVGAVFGPPDRIRPAWFVWKGRKHLIREVTYTWDQREGTAWIQNFSVSDGANLYHIAYHRDAMTWRLVALEDGG